jgi:hypothetical protein
MSDRMQTDLTSVFPNNFVSHLYHEDQSGRSWALVSFGIRRLPRWIIRRNLAEPGWCVFREILYLSETGELDGIGRAWVLPGMSLIRMLIMLCNPLAPQPLGVALRKLYGNDLEIAIVEDTVLLLTLTPYRLTEESVHRYHRVVSCRSNSRTLAFTEEQFIQSALDRTLVLSKSSIRA